MPGLEIFAAAILLAADADPVNVPVTVWNRLGEPVDGARLWVMPMAEQGDRYSPLSFATSNPPHAVTNSTGEATLSLSRSDNYFNLYVHDVQNGQAILPRVDPRKPAQITLPGDGPLKIVLTNVPADWTDGVLIMDQFSGQNLQGSVSHGPFMAKEGRIEVTLSAPIGDRLLLSDVLWRGTPRVLNLNRRGPSETVVADFSIPTELLYADDELAGPFRDVTFRFETEAGHPFDPWRELDSVILGDRPTWLFEACRAVASRTLTDRTQYVPTELKSTDNGWLLRVHADEHLALNLETLPMEEQIILDLKPVSEAGEVAETVVVRTLDTVPYPIQSDDQNFPLPVVSEWCYAFSGVERTFSKKTSLPRNQDSNGNEFLRLAKSRKSFVVLSASRGETFAQLIDEPAGTITPSLQSAETYTIEAVSGDGKMLPAVVLGVMPLDAGFTSVLPIKATALYKEIARNGSRPSPARFVVASNVPLVALVGTGQNNFEPELVVLKPGQPCKVVLGERTPRTWVDLMFTNRVGFNMDSPVQGEISWTDKFGRVTRRQSMSCAMCFENLPTSGEVTLELFNGPISWGKVTFEPSGQKQFGVSINATISQVPKVVDVIPGHETDGGKVMRKRWPYGPGRGYGFF